MLGPVLSVLGIKGHFLSLNEATQLVDYLMYIIEEFDNINLKPLSCAHESQLSSCNGSVSLLSFVFSHTLC